MVDFVLSGRTRLGDPPGQPVQYDQVPVLSRMISPSVSCFRPAASAAAVTFSVSRPIGGPFDQKVVAELSLIRHAAVKRGNLNAVFQPNPNGKEHS
jgi:hypothetical protein